MRKLRQNRDEEKLKQDRGRCLHTHDGLEGTVLQRLAVAPRQRAEFSQQSLETSIFKRIEIAPGCECVSCDKPVTSPAPPTPPHPRVGARLTGNNTTPRERERRQVGGASHGFGNVSDTSVFFTET